MNNLRKLLVLLLVTLILVPVVSSSNERWIVKVSKKPGKLQKIALKLAGIDIVRETKHLPFVIIKSSSSKLSFVKRIFKAEYIEKDSKVYATQEDEIKWNVYMVYGGDPYVVWNYTKGYNEEVEIAILDTGIDYNHSEFGGRIISCEGFGYESCLDDNGHGTHVAGIAAAALNNDGMVGVAPEVRLAIKKVLGYDGSGYVSDVIAGIDDAINDSNEIISMSFGSDFPSKALHDAIKEAYKKGIVLVAAAGNDYIGVDYPAAYKEVIAVAACDENKKIPSWSSSGRQVELTAPGVNVYSTTPTYSGFYLQVKYGVSSNYDYLSGTSMATPHVSAAAAILKAWDPSLTNEEIREILDSTAEDLGYSSLDQGNGLVRVDKAFECLLNDLSCLAKGRGK